MVTHADHDVFIFVIGPHRGTRRPVGFEQPVRSFDDLTFGFQGIKIANPGELWYGCQQDRCHHQDRQRYLQIKAERGCLVIFPDSPIDLYLRLFTASD